FRQCMAIQAEIAMQRVRRRGNAGENLQRTRRRFVAHRPDDALKQHFIRPHAIPKLSWTTVRWHAGEDVASPGADPLAAGLLWQVPTRSRRQCLRSDEIPRAVRACAPT